MGEIVRLNNSEQQNHYDTNLIEIAEGVLLDTRESIETKQVISMPIAELATLGMGVASLIPTFRTITETTVINGDGLFRLANASVGDTLKVAKNGNFWGAFKTIDGTSKFAQLQAAGSVPATTTTVMPLDPASIMMAIALFSIEQKLGNIVEMEKQILSFLHFEKESKIEADIETLTSLLKQYKFAWNNEHFIASSHKMVMDIQRSSRQYMISYQKDVANVLDTKKIVVYHAKVNEMLNDLLRKFKYYRLSLYIFAMASFVEVLLSGEFKEENLSFVRDEIEKLSLAYRELFDQCSAYLEKLNDVAIDTAIAKGIGTASKVVGKLIGSIPVVKDGSVDELLQDSGEQMKEKAVRIEQEVVKAFAELNNPRVGIFIEKINDMIQIYGRTQEIYFDNKIIYLVAG